MLAWTTVGQCKQTPHTALSQITSISGASAGATMLPWTQRQLGTDGLTAIIGKLRSCIGEPTQFTESGNCGDALGGGGATIISCAHVPAATGTACVRSRVVCKLGRASWSTS